MKISISGESRIPVEALHSPLFLGMLSNSKCLKLLRTISATKVLSKNVQKKFARVGNTSSPSPSFTITVGQLTEWKIPKCHFFISHFCSKTK